jgi:serine/threonine-protein kinase HipA
LISDLESGAAFRGLGGARFKGKDDGDSPFPDLVTRTWVKELKHRRRLMEG